MDSSGSNVRIQRLAGALSQLFNPGRLPGPLVATYITRIHVLNRFFPTIICVYPHPIDECRSVLPMAAWNNQVRDPTPRRRQNEFHPTAFYFPDIQPGGRANRDSSKLADIRFE